MHADRSAAARAGPSRFLFLKKISKAGTFNIPKIFDHAHGVFGPVSFIKMFQLIAGEGRAFKTKLRRAFPENFAVFDPAAGAGRRFAGVGPPAARTLIFFSQISHAHAAIHAAGRDKRKFIQGYSGRDPVFHGLPGHTSIILSVYFLSGSP